MRLAAAGLVASFVLGGCSGDGDGTAPTARVEDTIGTALWPERLTVVESQRIAGVSGGSLNAAGVTVTLPARVSATDLDVKVLSPVPVEAHEAAGPVVGVVHAGPIEAPILVEWDVATLTTTQQSSLMLVRWDDTERAWLVEDQPFDIVDGTLRASIINWSFWSWVANTSQEVQELVGRREDPPQCSRSMPSWAHNFVDPDADTSAAAVLVCIEDDPGDTSRLTMRIVNNRTAAQLVHVGGDEPIPWVWEGELPLDVAGSVQTAAGSVLTDSHEVLVPPLHEIAIGVQRPGMPGVHHVEFSNEINASTILADVVAFGARKVNVGDAFDNPIAAIFFEVVIGCGVAEVVAWRGDVDEIARSIISAVASCAQAATTYDTELGRQFQQRVSERIVAYGSPEAARNAIKANRIVHAAAGYLSYLALFEIVGYLSDIGLEATVGSLTWSLNLTGQPRDPGDWTPTCDDIEADQQAWSRNWVTQPVFNQPPLRDFHAYTEFPSILTAATAPLGTCTLDHVRAVRDKIAEVGFQTDEAGTIALGIVDELLATTAGTSTGECDAHRMAADLGRSEVGVEVCEAGWAYVNLCSEEFGCGDAQSIIRQIDGTWATWMLFPQPTVCRDDMAAAEAPTSIIDRVNWSCDGQREVLYEGSRSTSRVAALEQELVARGLLATADGDFDATTTHAVRTFQDRAGLEADGLAGPATLAAVGAGLGNLGKVGTVDQAVGDIVKHLNGDSSAGDLPPDTRAALSWVAPFDEATWTASGTMVQGDRHLINLVLGGDGGVYTYATVCLKATKPVTWCGIYELAAH